MNAISQKVLAFGLLACCGLALAAKPALSAPSAPAHYLFYDTQQPLEVLSSRGVDLGDLDGDGDFDAFIALYGANTVWLNDGLGALLDSGQELGAESSTAVVLGDLDGDHDLDAFVGNRESFIGAPDMVWLNDGNGLFSLSAQRLAEQVSMAIALGDVDGDHDLDAFVAACGPGFPATDMNILWLNDGKASFSQSGQDFGALCSSSAVMGDINGDMSLDIVVGNAGSSTGIEIWLNDSLGSGLFTKTQVLDHGYNFGLALGDLDGDSDLDLWVANGEGAGGASPNLVWLNNGSGVFSDSGQRLGNESSNAVRLGDLDLDGDLDAVVANGAYNQTQPNRVWVNDGAGIFSDSGQSLGLDYSRSLALADLDGDGDLDQYVANANVDEIWFGNTVLREKYFFPVVYWDSP